MIEREEHITLHVCYNISVRDFYDDLFRRRSQLVRRLI